MVMKSFDQMLEEFISLCIIGYTVTQHSNCFHGSGPLRIDPTCHSTVVLNDYFSTEGLIGFFVNWKFR
jgi:hypothetical protein